MHLDTETLCGQRDLRLQLVVDVLSVGEEIVELVASDDRAQARHCDALAGEPKVVHSDDGLDRVVHPEVDDGVDLQGDVVGRDRRLGGNVDHLDPEVHLDDPVDCRNAEDQARALGLRTDPPETEEHRPLVLGHHRQERTKGDHHDDRQDDYACDDPANEVARGQNA